MSNYKPRYLIEVVIAKHGELIRSQTMTTDDKADAEAYINLIEDGRDAWLTDRATAHRASTPAGARARGYYGLRYSGTDINSFVGGKIDRAADEALDRLDDLVEEKRVGFEARHQKSWAVAHLDLALTEELAAVS